MAVTTELAVKLKQRVRRALDLFRFLALAMVATFTLDRLGYLNLDGLAPVGAAVLSIFVATTGLLYNRARAYGPGILQRRTLHAAEQALRASLLLIVGIAITAGLFYLIPDSQRTDPKVPKPQHFLPTLLAVFPGLFFGFAAWAYVGALQTLLPPMITALRPRSRLRRELDRGKKQR